MKAAIMLRKVMLVAHNLNIILKIPQNCGVLHQVEPM